MTMKIRKKKKAMLNHLKLAEELRKSRLTQEEFAEEIGISDRHVRNLLKIDKNISVELAYNLSDCFGVAIEDLLVIAEEKD